MAAYRAVLCLAFSLVPVCLGSIPGLDTEDTRDGIRAPKPYYILEELPARTLIGNVAIDAKLRDRYEKSVLSQLTYRFLDQVDDEGHKVDLFEIDEKTGIVKTKIQIDRDVICARKITCLVHLNIGLSPQQYFLEIKVVVDILDVNDNAPYFPEAEIFKQISEAPSASPPTLSIPTAIDPDSQTYSVQNYELVSSSDKFHLIQETNPDGTVDLSITADDLDREVINFYQFKIVAYDGGSPQKSGSMLVNIEVLDANDNEPRFDNSTYEIFVLETVQANTTIGRVEAKDRDADSELKYSFTDKTQRQYGGTFGIVEKTGAIYIRRSLDFEQGATYMLSIKADDGGPHFRPATATVIVRVEDSNDNAPEISINTLTSSGVAQVSESADIGTFVAHVSVTDLDGGDNGKVNCDLDHGNFNLQKLEEGQFKVTTSAKLNREKDPVFNVQVTCHDMGVQRKTSSSTFSVQVLDSNDHAPIFSQPVYSATLRENNFVDDEVIRVNATDIDYGINGQVQYKLHEDALGLFKIHPTRGIVTANAIFDRETMSEFTFKVIASDQGSPVQSSTATVNVHILDENDEKPTFVQDQYNFGIFENEKPGSEVGSVEAVDKDIAPNNEFTYMIVKSLAGNTVEDAFRIDAVTGKLVTTKVPDREQHSVYYLTIEVKSKRGVFPQTSSSVTVTVYIADRNDNSPVITWPNFENNTVYISNRTPKDSKVAHVIAHDRDIGDNGKLAYELRSHEENFAISPVTGVVSLKTELDNVVYEKYTLRIAVRDHGSPILRTEGELNVVVNSTLLYPEPNVIVTNNNITIIVSLTSAFLILVFLAIIALVLFRKTVQEQKGNPFTFRSSPSPPPEPKVRRESQKMLTPREETPDGRESSPRSLQSEPSTSQNPFYGSWDIRVQRACDCGSENRAVSQEDVEIDMGPDMSSGELKKSNLKYLQNGSPLHYNDLGSRSYEGEVQRDHYRENDDLEDFDNCQNSTTEVFNRNIDKRKLGLPLESRA